MDKVIRAIDMRLKFGTENKEYRPRTCFVFTELAGSTLVVGIVNFVTEVFQIKEEEI